MTVVGYQTVLDNIVTLLNNAKATTLSTNLTTAVQQVIKGDPNNIPVQANMYPTVFVYLTKKDEDWVTLGGALKQTVLTFEIYALVLLTGTSDSSDQEVRYLSDNIENLLRANSDLQGTVDFCNPSECSFERAFKEGTYLSCAVITLEVRKTIQ